MITRDGAKMSKSKGNVVCPAPIVDRYGADTARCYILFIGPPDQDADWSDEGVEGMHRFLGRLWRLGAEVAEHGAAARRSSPTSERARGRRPELLRKAHWAIDKVTATWRAASRSTRRSPPSWSWSTSAYAPPRGGRRRRAALRGRHRGVADLPVRAAPGRRRLRAADRRRVWEEPWPVADPALLERDNVELVVQVNGKVRDRVPGAGGRRARSSRRSRAAAERVAHLDGSEVVKVIVVPAKLVNFVVR